MPDDRLYVLTDNQYRFAAMIGRSVKRDRRPHFVQLAITCLDDKQQPAVWTMSVPGMEQL